MDEALAERVRKLYRSAWEHHATRWESDLNTAAAELRDYLEHQPDSVPALTSLGAVLADRGEHAEATRVLRRAIQLGSSDANSLYNLAVALMSAGASGRVEARELFGRARSLRADPRTLRAYFDPHGH